MRTVPIEILLVDDDELDIELTREALASSKISNNIATAKDGIEALAHLRREPGFDGAPRPDVILLDLNMPRMDGHELLVELKADPDLAAIPVVVITTSDEEADVVRSYQLQAAAFITKPVGLAAIGDVVRSIEDFWLQVVRYPAR